MGNLLTKEGPVYAAEGPPGLKIAGDPITTASLSDYGKYYGTYSGVDVKVVVHYPHDPAIEKHHVALIAELEADLVWLDDVFQEFGRDFSMGEIQDHVAEKEALRAEIASLDKDINDFRNFPTSRVLGEITSFSWSTFRDKAPFRPLGSVYPKAYTRGPRTISGTMVFTIFHEHVFHELMRLGLKYYSTGCSDFDKHTYTTMLADQLPPLDISLIFANEYGAISHMGFWGVEFFQEGGTFSIEDIYSENVIHYVTRDIDPMRIVEQREIDGHGVSKEWNKTASTMLSENQLTSSRIRRNPFI